jgi:CheY-like chemotaxis protein
VYFPRDARISTSWHAVESSGTSAAPLASHHVLVVDDNADAAETLSMVLRLGGHEVRVAHDGPAALEAARVRLPDIAFLDIGMPHMDGLEVARRMRQLPGGDAVVLVAVTGWGLEDDRRRTHDAGFDFHLVKPVSPEKLNDLLAQVDSVPSRPAAHVDKA